MRPDLSSIHAAARRERALAMHRLVFAPIVAFFRGPFFRRSRKIELQVAACHS